MPYHYSTLYTMYNCIYTSVIIIIVFVHVHLMPSIWLNLDSDPASWAALVAQLVEHLSGVQCVVGSNPT